MRGRSRKDGTGSPHAFAELEEARQPRTCPASQPFDGGKTRMMIRHLIDRRTAERESYASHLRTKHSLPADAVAAIDHSGVDLGAFHDDEHNNDDAIGRGSHSTGPTS